MIPRFCQYCGQASTENCDCAIEAAAEHERFLEEYENDLEHQYGWHQQDMIDMRRRER